MQVGTHRQYIMPHTGELPPNLANSLRQAQTALTVAKGWAEKHYGPRLHPNTFTILSSLTYDPAALNDIHGSESDRDSPAADAVTRPSTEVELDVRDECQFPKLSRPTAPPTRCLYMGSRPTLTEQYPQIRNKSTPISHIAPKPEQLAICNTERRVTSSTPLPPRRTGPIKGNRTGANCPSIHTPNSSPISSDPPTLPGAGRLAAVGPEHLFLLSLFLLPRCSHHHTIALAFPTYPSSHLHLLAKLSKNKLNNAPNSPVFPQGGARSGWTAPFTGHSVSDHKPDFGHSKPHCGATNMMSSVSDIEQTLDSARPPEASTTNFNSRLGARGGVSPRLD